MTAHALPNASNADNTSAKRILPNYNRHWCRNLAQRMMSINLELCLSQAAYGDYSPNPYNKGTSKGTGVDTRSQLIRSLMANQTPTNRLRMAHSPGPKTPYQSPRHEMPATPTKPPLGRFATHRCPVCALILTSSNVGIWSLTIDHRPPRCLPPLRVNGRLLGTTTAGRRRLVTRAGWMDTMPSERQRLVAGTG